MVAKILNVCGKDMAIRYNLHHWDNPFLKSLAIVILCKLRNDVFLLYDANKPVATFMTKKNGDVFHFEKLGTLPSDSGKGIGTHCIKMIEEMAKAFDCKRITMEVYEPSQHAISFYKHRGYNVVGLAETMKYKEVKMEKSI